MRQGKRAVYFGHGRLGSNLIVAGLAVALGVACFLCVQFKMERDGGRQAVVDAQSAQATAEAQVTALTEELAQAKQAEEERLAAEAAERESVELAGYAEDYPQLYAQSDWNAVEVAEKTVYLTFDDGPSSLTDQILDSLAAAEVKATFFILGSQLDTVENQKRLQRMVDEGHTVGVHTDSHVYGKIYASVDAFLADFNAVWQKIVDITGVEPQVFRFPGGSVNAYNGSTYSEIIAEMTRRGFVYYDWNTSAGDATGAKTTPADILASSTTHKNASRVILLMHDSKSKVDTAAALPDIIAQYKAEGYAFAHLTAAVKPVVFGYPRR